jgi:hypothetical protein
MIGDALESKKELRRLVLPRVTVRNIENWDGDVPHARPDAWIQQMKERLPKLEIEYREDVL